MKLYQKKELLFVIGCICVVLIDLILINKGIENIWVYVSLVSGISSVLSFFMVIREKKEEQRNRDAI